MSARSLIAWPRASSRSSDIPCRGLDWGLTPQRQTESLARQLQEGDLVGALRSFTGCLLRSVMASEIGNARAGPAAGHGWEVAPA